MQDTGWIYSSVIQSTAAFIAIVGGFFTGTILQLVAKKTGIDDELEDVHTELERVKALHHSAVVKRDRFLVHEAISENEERIVDNWPDFAKPDDAKIALELDDVDDEAFSSEWNPYWRKVEDLREVFIPAMERHGALKPFFDDWLKASSLPDQYSESWTAKLVFLRERNVWLEANPEKGKKQR